MRGRSPRSPNGPLDTDQQIRAALGAHRDALTGCWAVPTETTIRRTLARLDPEALAGVIGAWLADRDRPDQRRRRAVAVDGKTVRGARRDHSRVHLLAVMDHVTRAVLAQRDVDAKTNESLWPCGPRGSDEMLAAVRRARSSL